MRSITISVTPKLFTEDGKEGREELIMILGRFGKTLEDVMANGGTIELREEDLASSRPLQ